MIEYLYMSARPTTYIIFYNKTFIYYIGNLTMLIIDNAKKIVCQIWRRDRMLRRNREHKNEDAETSPFPKLATCKSNVDSL